MSSCSTPSSKFAFDDPASALIALMGRLRTVATERVPLSDATGRVLAESIVTDRPSPACDVSAMDGYAVRCEDLADGATLPICGEVATGHAPPSWVAGHAMRIFTGGAAPAEADAVIRREDVEEMPEAIRLRVPATSIRYGDNLRRRGENAPQGTCVAQAGRIITAPVAAALASFGYAQVTVRRRVRVAMLTTGDEVLGAEADPEPWQLRDSNGPALWAMLNPAPWLSVQNPRHVIDDPNALRAAFDQALAETDAVIATGGVSMGDHDHVSAMVREAGCQVIFHGLPIRPGKPVLGAVGPEGQLVLGLPGNPVSVMATGRRLAVPALRQAAGITPAAEHPAHASITNPDDRSLKLHWYRPVRRTGANHVELMPTQGSGDIVSTAGSDGFVELPAGSSGAGPWAFYSWSIW